MKRQSALLAGFLSVVGFAASASATPITGVLNIAGSVAVSALNLDFRPPTDGGFGNFTTVVPGTGYFAGIPSPQPPFYTGDSVDLTLGPSGGGFTHVAIGPTSVPDFLNTFTAPGYSGLTFNLTDVIAPTAPMCTGAEGANAVCSLGPFTITVNANLTTTIAMVLLGDFQDSSVPNSSTLYSGRYSTQDQLSTSGILNVVEFGGHDPGCATGDNGEICDSYSANFNPVPVPEPASMLTFGVGSGLLALLRRRAAKRKTGN